MALLSRHDSYRLPADSCSPAARSLNFTRHPRFLTFPFWNSPHLFLQKITPLISCAYGSPFCNPFAFRFMQEWGCMYPPSWSGRSDVETFRRSDDSYSHKPFRCNTYVPPRKCCKQKTCGELGLTLSPLAATHTKKREVGLLQAKCRFFLRPPKFQNSRRSDRSPTAVVERRSRPGRHVQTLRRSLPHRGTIPPPHTICARSFRTGGRHE